MSRITRRSLLYGLGATALPWRRDARAQTAAPPPPLNAPPSPPIAAKRPVRLVQHGIERIDDYAWLKDPNWRAVMRDAGVLGPEIHAYLDAENAYSTAMLAPLAPLRATLLAELKGRLEQFDSGVPTPDGPWAYWSKFVPGAEHVQVVRAPRQGGAEQLLLDGPQMAVGKPYFLLNDYGHSPDHKLMAYTVDETGSEALFLRIRDLATGYDSAYIIPDASDFAWAFDSRTLFYVKRDENQRARFVYRHAVGSDPTGDVLVYEEPDPAFDVSVYRTRTNRFVVLASSNLDTSEVRLIDAASPASPPRLVAPRQAEMRYSIDDWGDDLVIRTNADGAADYKLMLASPQNPAKAGWRPLVGPKDGVQIEGFLSYAQHLVRLEREDGQQRIVVRRKQDGAEHIIAFDEEAFTLALSAPYEFDTRLLRFSSSSPKTPRRVTDYDVDTRERTLRKEQRVPSGHNPDDYVVRRLFAPAADGERVPLTVLHKKGVPLDGNAPAFLTGYGAYAVSLNPEFNENALTLVDRGFVYAIAHGRGGLEKGDRWREAGRRRNKMNSFTDFIAVTEFLIAQKFSAAGRIVAHGASAGGLLVGGVANMRPELYAGIVARVPFVDAINTMLDTSLPLTASDASEWGDPITDVEAYRSIAAYSPYDNVKAQAYPPMLITAGLTDPRVTYWEPAKWTARLRATKTDHNAILLVTNMSAGHGGAAGRFEGLDEVAMIYAFVLAVIERRL